MILAEVGQTTIINIDIPAAIFIAMIIVICWCLKGSK